MRRGRVRSWWWRAACSITLVGTLSCERGRYFPACHRDGDCRRDGRSRCVDGLCQNCVTDADCTFPEEPYPGVCHEHRCMFSQGTDYYQEPPLHTAKELRERASGECRKDRHCKEEWGERCIDRLCQNCLRDEDCSFLNEPNGRLAACVDFRCTYDWSPDGTQCYAEP